MGEVGLSACWDTTFPSGPGTPWDQALYPPNPGNPPGQGTPLRSACWEIWSTSGRYASYWNAILVYLSESLGSRKDRKICHKNETQQGKFKYCQLGFSCAIKSDLDLAGFKTPCWSFEEKTFVKQSLM